MMKNDGMRLCLAVTTFLMLFVVFAVQLSLIVRIAKLQNIVTDLQNLLADISDDVVGTEEGVPPS